MDIPDVFPTPRERELWTKALQTPDQVTEAEKVIILRLADVATQAASVFKVSGLTPGELQSKALTTPESLTEEECHLISNRYHIWNPYQACANSIMHWSNEDQTAHWEALCAVATPRDDALSLAVGLRSDHFAAARMKKSREDMATHAQDIDRPCKWVRKLAGPPAQGEPTTSWGFVILSDSSIDSGCDDYSWNKFLSVMESCAEKSLKQMNGGMDIIPTKKFILADGHVSENNPEILRSNFQQRRLQQDILDTRILSNTFLLITPEVVTSCINTSTPWIWAYDADFVPSTATPPSLASGQEQERYQGRLRVSLYSLFTWFYAVRSEGLYGMSRFWEKAQNQGQIWSVATSLGRYHHPFVLLEKGSSYPWNAYELENGS
ncbi:hypothetical protein VE01_04541 [Pseudogymnoascus verrucosus]|uniref:Uncharacterized protein n=1 Tax=Pseudogymnoascus verrucosus TaxID=342668 RepID=A0A1B8GP63_9PEZI|nr:uncharacterized protein VE01_04541 [Pseudogymnoascus verrucosus]OBT97635.1 hypothetical protein VE01_04541 [Pseudogymnoascus verrucosus]